MNLWKISVKISELNNYHMAAKTIKNDGTYDNRTKEGRQSKGKTLHPKKTEKQMDRALKTKNKPGK